MPTLRSIDNGLLNKAPCFILHKHPYKERDLLLELLTLEYGRLRAICRLGKRAQLRNNALLQSFVPLRLTLFKGRGELYNVGEIRQEGAAFKIAIPNLFCAQYLNEILYKLCHEEESIPELFGIYLKTLKLLEQGVTPHLPLRLFESVFLKNLGYSLDVCDNQGHAFLDNALYTFDVRNGFALSLDQSLDCYQGAILNKIALGDYASPEVLVALKRLHSQLLQMLLDYKPLQSHKLYSQYLSLQEI